MSTDEKMSLPETRLNEEDPKRARVLEGAMKTFLAYGYERTTMDDIAKAAEMSRPALYLIFRNKAEIYQAIGSVLLGRSLEQANTELSGDGPLGERLMRAFEVAIFSMIEAIEQSPHGADILDMKNALATGLLETWQSGLLDMVTDAIEAEAQRTGVTLFGGLSARDLASVALDAIEGTKARGGSIAEKRRTARSTVALIEKALATA
jgi:AcrR family transcriptional regulator